MELSSYAELAVRLVNTASLGHEGGDQLATLDGLRNLVTDREHLNQGINRADLEALRMLREEFRAFFVAAAQGNGQDAAARLNELLIQYPVHSAFRARRAGLARALHGERLDVRQVRGGSGDGPGRPARRPRP